MERVLGMRLADNIRDLSKPPVKFKRRPEVLCHPQIPKPMHTLAPRVILGSSWWDVTREAAYRSTGFHCVACGVHQYYAVWHQWMEGHELYSIDYLLGRMTYVETVPLCHLCHNFIHQGRLQALLDNKEITREKFDLVIAHGTNVLKKAKLKKPPPYDGSIADWDDWRLVLNGKEYPPRIKCFADWCKKYEPKNTEVI